MRAYSGRLPRIAVTGMLVASGALLLVQSVRAQVAPPFATLLRDSENAPRSAAIAADVARAEGLAEQARARPNPTVSVMAENIAGRAPYRGFDGAENTLQYNQPFELGGKRSARIAAGEAEVGVARARASGARATYAHDLALAYAMVEIAQRRVELADDEVEEAEADLKLARALVDVGKEARLRSLQAESALNALRADRDLARANLTGALARLSALAGAPQTFTGISGSVLAMFERPAIVGPVDAGSSAIYRLALAERDAAALRIRVEEKRAIPDVTGQLGVRRLERDNATAMIVGVSVPLPLFDRNRGNVAAVRAEAQGAASRAEAARIETEAELRGAIAQAEASESRVTAAQASLATADEAYRLARIAYESGKAPLIELLTARHNLGSARGVVLDTLAARFAANATLARLQGRTITGDLIP
ncbi:MULTISPECIES: TolC family protein [Sphingomonadaceae]|jgi:cobalt-zinc-cadmium efflux system outer membrane protein|uniref:Metal transporter n=2 Tax=Sphingomonadaceae TaxID=41297 RepID=A0A2K2FXV1_9SPHN|nr:MULTISPECIES: TolC family protein [Sphingomonadaceae]KEZ21496.1 Metal ion efflux outer membrane factor protein family protein [Sphingobium yanoikuyae]MAM38958.1 TolC family protein [Erythrobacter sp.]PNU03592.1 metal transporter [Novosphingobium guangzhouense]GFE74212.1 metal transporter [Novosphingobium sp. TCA1]